MIVCSCNIIRDCDIRAAAERGCTDAQSVYRSMGCEFECGGCRDHAEEIVEQAFAAPPQIEASAA